MSIDAAKIPASPLENDAATAWRESIETLELLSQRRSTKLMFLAEPGPTADQTSALLRLAARAPDHGKLGPWRFVVIEGEGRTRAGEALARVIEGDDAVNPERIKFEKERFLAAPLCVMVVSNVQPHKKIPEWEQLLSSAAVCYGLLIAAHAMGFAGTWLTEWMTYDERARAALGLQSHERIAGLVYIGSGPQTAPERARPDIESRVTRF
ncbi:MAG: nitroreductase [Caulobacterales bacterium]